MEDFMDRHFSISCLVALCGLVIFFGLSSAESKYRAYDIDNQEVVGYVAE